MDRRQEWQSARGMGPRSPYARRRARITPHPNYDPWYKLERESPELFTYLSDVIPGWHEGLNVDWSEVEDWSAEARVVHRGDHAPPRPVINGRKDYTPPLAHRARVMRPINTQLKEELDLISERDLVAEFRVALKTVETWTAEPDFPRAYGYRVDAVRNWSGEALLYDRIDVYEWIEGTHPELNPFEEE